MNSLSTSIWRARSHNAPACSNALNISGTPGGSSAMDTAHYLKAVPITVRVLPTTQCRGNGGDKARHDGKAKRDGEPVGKRARNQCREERASGEVSGVGRGQVGQSGRAQQRLHRVVAQQ